MFSVNYCHIQKVLGFFPSQRSRNPQTANPSGQSNYNAWNTTVQTPPARVNILSLPFFLILIIKVNYFILFCFF